MKKEEALKIAPEKSKLLCDFIIQILSENEKINGEIRIDFDKINNEKMILFDINIPSKGINRHVINTGITTQQINVLTEQILADFIDNFLASEIMGCTRYYSIRGGYGMNMDGVNIANTIGSKIKINFVCRGDKFIEQIENYNSRINEYINEQELGSKMGK